MRALAHPPAPPSLSEGRTQYISKPPRKLKRLLTPDRPLSLRAQRPQHIPAGSQARGKHALVRLHEFVGREVESLDCAQ